MKRILIIAIFLIVLFGCNTQKERGKIPLSSEEIIGYEYNNVVKLLEDNGFTNIKLIPEKTLDSKIVSNLKNTISSIEIEESNDFKKNKTFNLSSEIIIKYYSYIEEKMPIVSKEAKGMSYEDIIKLFTDSSFINVKSELILDNEKDNVNEEEIEYITINGVEDFDYNMQYPIDSEIVVYYSYLEEKMPISSNEAKGKEYNEVIELLSKTRFEIETCLIRDVDKDNTHENEIEYIEIASLSDYSLDDTYPIKTKVVVYHSYIEEKMPLLSADTSGKNYEEILKIFNKTKFDNISIKNTSNYDNVDVLETTVDKITINGNSIYTLDETFPYNSEIVIYYAVKEYNYDILLECDENWLLNTYDVSVYLNDEYLGTVDHGATRNFKGIARKGEYKLLLKSDEDTPVTGSASIKIEKDQQFRYSIHCYGSEVDIKEYPQLNLPYTNDDAVGELYTTIEQSFKDAGFKNIDIISLNDLDKNNLKNSNKVSKVEINGNDSFSKNDNLYSDSEVVITYHSGILTKVPMSSSDVVDENYKTILEKFKEVGFVNVKAEKYTGNYKSKARNGMVKSVEINGEDYFLSSDEFSLDADVVIYYYSIDYEKVSVSKMMNALEKNSYNANKYYTNRYVAITGYVGSIDTNGKKLELVASSSDWDFLGITCEITNNSQKDTIAKLSTGKKITIKGKVTLTTDLGYYLDIHEIVK